MQQCRESPAPEAPDDRPAAATFSIDDLPGPKPVPLFGNALQVKFSQLHVQLERWSEQFGTLFKLRFGPKTVLVVADAALTDQVLRCRPEGYRRPSMAARISSEMGRPTGLFFAEGEVWQRQRRMVAASFTADAIRAYFPRLQQVTQRLAARWQRCVADGQPVPLDADLKRFTVDVVAGLAFGVDVNSLESGTYEVQSHIDAIFAASFRRSVSVIPYWRFLPTLESRRLKHSVGAVNSAIDRFIALARQRKQADPSDTCAPANLLDAMLRAAAQAESGITDADIAGNVAAMLFAGEDSPASTLSWLIYLLARHPAQMHRCRDEVRRCLADEGGHSLEQLSSLEFLDACVREAMRLKPVSPFIAVESLRDNRVADVRVPPGTLVICLVRQAGMDSVADRPREFVPSRWLAAGASGERALKLSSRSFGVGPRMCPGRYLALLEIKSVLAMLLSHFDIQHVGSPSGEVLETMSVTMNPGPLRMLMRRRP